jgi:5'-nucleotidase
LRSEAAASPGRLAAAARLGRTLGASTLIACGASLASPTDALAGSDTPAGTPAPLCANGPLDILVTNDDGVSAQGLRSLATALAAAGHRVTIAAPESNASGSSVSFTWGEVLVRRETGDPPTYAVSATPAATVVLAATTLYEAGRRPDLIVSGINNGLNTGRWLVLSGTVGAALAGTILLDPPVPGFAVSAARVVQDVTAGPTSSREHLDSIAEHAAKLIAATRGWFCDGGRISRGRTVLNVNYPARPAATLRGAVVASQGQFSDLSVRFEPAAEGRYRAKVDRTGAPPPRDSAEQMLALGYVTVTPVDAELGSEDAPQRDLKRRLRGL